MTSSSSIMSNPATRPAPDASGAPRASRRARRATSRTGIDGEMPWSLGIGRLFGIPLRLHATFLVLVAFVALNATLAVYRGAPVDDALADLALGALLFASVVVHELGHALVARRYGIATKEIVLFPIGGVARIERIPEAPRQEILIALAGPAVSFALAGTGFGVAALLGKPSDMMTALSGTFVVTMIAWMNLVLAVFNLLPAYPMDGGRVLRALLALRMARTRATLVAARVGQAFALALGLFGLFAQPMLVVMAFFLFLGAAAEANEARVTAVLTGRSARAGMMSEFTTLAPSQPLADAVAATLGGSQRDFPVVDADGVYGMLTYEGLLRGLSSHGAAATIGSAMDSKVVTASPDEPLELVLARMRDGNARAALVVAMGAPAGLIVPENLAELVELSGAAATPRAHA